MDKVKIDPPSHAYRLLNPGAVVLITVGDGKKDNLFAVTWNMPVRKSPPMIAILSGKRHHSFRFVARTGEYGVNVLGNSINLPALNNRWTGTAIAVGTALILAFATGADGKGALKLWPLFGAVNQTLAALALIIITLYLKARGGLKWLIAGLPAIFMAVMTIWAVIMNQIKFGATHNVLLQVINICILFVALWIAVEGVVKFFVA